MSGQRTIDHKVDETNYFVNKFHGNDLDTVFQHHDMRNAMRRISAPAPISDGGQPFEDKLSNLQDHVLTKADGSKEVYVKYFIGSFKLGEITVTIEDGVLNVDARHSETEEKAHVYDVFSRHFTLPKGTDISQMSSTLMRDGVLVLRAPIKVE